MGVSEHWRYQGRQYHQWFGHGTAPKEDNEPEPPTPGSLFDPASVAQRITYAIGSVVAHAPRDQRSRWEIRIGGANKDNLSTAIGTWYGASKLGRDVFLRLLDPNTSDETVDRLRRAAAGIVDARTTTALGAAGEDLAMAAQAIGLDRWPRFIGDAERRSLQAVSDGAVPGVIKASTIVDDITMGIIVGGVIVYMATRDDKRPRKQASQPASPQAAVPQGGRQGGKDAAPPPETRPPNLAPEGATRDEALEQAKKDHNIAPEEKPDVQPNARGGKNARGSENLDYLDRDNKFVRLRHDYDGDQYPDDPSQNRGPLFNFDYKSGKSDHYDYNGNNDSFGQQRR